MMLNRNFKPRLESHFDLSALSTSVVEPELYTKNSSSSPKYNMKIHVGTDGKPSAFDIEIYKKKSRLIEGTKRMKKIVHEVVANLLGAETDIRLSTIGITGGDGRLTPDFIDEDKKLIVELTTTVNTDPRNTEERFQQKIVHYRDAIKGSGYGLGIVVVGETFVYSNLLMSQQMVDALCQRCRIGIAIKSGIERFLGSSLDPTDTSEEEFMVEKVIRSMKKTPKSSKEFPLQDIMECTSGPSAQDFRIANKIFRRELKESKKKSPEGPGLLTDYLNSYTGNSRTDEKRVCNIPMIEPVISDPESVLEAIQITDSNMPLWLKKIWIASLSVEDLASPNKEDVIEEAFKTVKFSEKEDESRHKIQKHCAFNVKLDADDLEEASTTGLFGKKQKKTAKYKENKQKNKLSFHPLDSPTEDIDIFINKTNMLTESHLCAMPDDIRSLLRDAKSVWKNAESSTISEAMLKNISKTRLVNFAGLITKIFTEICYCYKYWIGRSDFYVKKIEGIYMLIRCTGTHVFCSFAYPKDYYSSFDTGRLGPTLFESDEWFFSDVSSYTEPVIEHFVKSGPYMASLISHQMCSMEMDITSKPMSNLELSKDMNGILLLFLNNKTDAEEVMTSQRYLTMGVLEDLDPNPYRFVERLPEFIKSRLTAYLVKRTANLIKRYSVPPIRMLVKEGDTSIIEYDGLVSFFGNETITFKRKIEEFYYGYVISKEKGRGGDRNFKIMKKIVEQEYVYRDNNYPEFSKTAETKTNQTNLPMMKVLCFLMKERMKDNYGSLWREVLEKKIISRLSKITFSELATLKVSSRDYSGKMNIPHVDDNMSTKEIQDKLKLLNPDDVSQRPRVMESLTITIEEFKKESRVDNVSHIIQIVPWCLAKIEKRGFFFSDIFPKPQHGGDREIHVLEIIMRVCQLFVEHISRSLCDMVPSDTLMHPRWKSTFVKDHYSRAENELETNRITIGKSADAAKWCQRNHASKFASVMASFLPEWMVKPVLRILYLWTTKVICFPIQFVANFISNRAVKSNKTYERMRDEFFSGSGIFTDAVSNRMTIKSGMMQGILHYTSSFVHGIIQEAMILLQTRILRKKGIKSVITMAQGSDDSAELISVSGKPVKNLVRISVTMLHWKENISKHIGIYTSRAKSCIGSSDMIEYNSEWYTRKNSIMPTFRWVSACLEVGVVEKFVDRIHNFYGTVTNVIEAGGKVLEASIIQQCQAWMHYHMLGLSNHILSSEVARLLKTLKDPALGYFPLDSDCNAGITGVDFQLYKYHKDSNYGYGVGANRIGLAELDMFEEDSKDPAVSQSLRRIRLKFGNHKIFLDLLRRMSAPELAELVEEVDGDPSILYYPPKTWNSSKLLIFMKLFEPGVKESLSRHSATARILSASAYMISRQCFTRAGVDGKISLFKALQMESFERLIGRSKKINVDEVFLYSDEYRDSLIDIESILENSVFQKVNMRSRSKQTIQVFDRMLNDIPVIEMCKEKWFQDGRTGLTPRQYRLKWEELINKFPFLRSSREETREVLNLTEIQLKNFLVSIDSKPRKLTLMDTAAKGTSVKSTMTRLFWPNIKLLKTGTNIEDEESAASIRSNIFSILTHWASVSEKRKAITDLLSKSEILSHSKVPARLQKIKCIRDLLSRKPQSEIINDIISEKIGCLGVFTIRQQGYGKERYGYGEWKGQILTSQVKIELEGPVCTRITVSNLKNKVELGRSILELLHNINAAFPTDINDSDHWLTPDGFINGGKGAMRGIPIDIQDDLKVTIFDDVYDWEWFVDFRYNSIRIRANSGSGNIITLISDTYRAYEWDPIYRMETGIFKNWNNSDPMNAEEIGFELSSFFNKTDATTLRELMKIKNNERSAVSASGWKLSDFKRVLKTFFSLKLSSEEVEASGVLEPEINSPVIEDGDLMFFQTGDFEIDNILADDLKDELDDLEFDANFNVENYIDENIELLMSEREISHTVNNLTMPPTNRCLNSLDGLSRALTGQPLRKLFNDCVEDDSKRFSGLMGKIMTLVCGTPRVLRQITELERNVFRQEEDAVSATMSIRTAEDLGNLDEGEIKDNIKDIDKMISMCHQSILRDNLLQTRSRFVNMLNLIDIKGNDNSISRIPSRDLILWLRDESGYFNDEMNIMYRLTDSSYILQLRDKLDDHVEIMCKNSQISEFELGLYREAIPKPHLTTLFLDVFSSYLGIKLKVGPYYTDPDGDFNFEFRGESSTPKRASV
jgi:hypothetical protein